MTNALAMAAVTAVLKDRLNDGLLNANLDSVEDVFAIGLNRADVMFRRNSYIEKPVLPSRLGFEAVGEVTALGAGVVGFSLGQRVNVVPGAPTGRGDAP